MSDSSQPHGLQPTRLLHPRDFPGKNTGVGCHCFLHGVRQEVSILGAGNTTPLVPSTEGVTSEKPLSTLHSLIGVVAAQETTFGFLRPLSTPPFQLQPSHSAAPKMRGMGSSRHQDWHCLLQLGFPVSGMNTSQCFCHVGLTLHTHRARDPPHSVSPLHSGRNRG